MSISLQHFRDIVANAKVLDGDVRVSDGGVSLVKVDFGGTFRKLVNKTAAESMKANYEGNRAVRQAFMNALAAAGVTITGRIRALLTGSDLVSNFSATPLSRRTIKQVLTLVDAELNRGNAPVRAANTRDLHAVNGFSMTTRQFDAMIDTAVEDLKAKVKSPVARQKIAEYAATLKGLFARCGANGAQPRDADPLCLRELELLFSGPLDRERVMWFISERMPFFEVENAFVNQKAAIDLPDFTGRCIGLIRTFDALAIDLPSQVDDLEKAMYLSQRNSDEDHQGEITHAAENLARTIGKLVQSVKEQRADQDDAPSDLRQTDSEDRVLEIVMNRSHVLEAMDKLQGCLKKWDDSNGKLVNTKLKAALIAFSKLRDSKIQTESDIKKLGDLFDFMVAEKYQEFQIASDSDHAYPDFLTV